MYKDIFVIYRLGDVLEQYPLRTSTGEYEPVYDRPRPYNDVEAEQANHLARQGQFKASCKLVSGGQMVEYSITTTQPPPSGKDGDTQSRAIRAASQLAFGRPRAFVEAQIAARSGADDGATIDPDEENSALDARREDDYYRG